MLSGVHTCSFWARSGVFWITSYTEKVETFGIVKESTCLSLGWNNRTEEAVVKFTGTKCSRGLLLLSVSCDPFLWPFSKPLLLEIIPLRMTYPLLARRTKSCRHRDDPWFPNLSDKGLWVQLPSFLRDAFKFVLLSYEIKTPINIFTVPLYVIIYFLCQFSFFINFLRNSLLQ